MDLQLQEMLAAHRHWLETEGQGGKRANFRGLDLSGQYFPAVDLSGASFRNAVLDGARFEGTQLVEADFSESHCYGTAFEECNLTRALFSRGDLEGIRFRASTLESANFLQAKAKALRLTDVVARFANFREALLSGAEWQRSVLEEAVLRGAVLHHARLTEVAMTRADCREADFTGSRCLKVIWRKVNAKQAIFNEVLLEESDLTEAEELDPSALSYTEKALRQRFDEQKSELLREARRIEAMRDGLRVERKKLDAVWEHLTEEKLRWGEVGITVFAQARRLRFIAALWFVIVAAFATQMVMRGISGGWNSANLLQIGLTGALVLFLLGLHLVAALSAYRASRALWQLTEGDGEDAHASPEEADEAPAPAPTLVRAD